MNAASGGTKEPEGPDLGQLLSELIRGATVAELRRLWVELNEVARNVLSPAQYRELHRLLDEDPFAGPFLDEQRALGHIPLWS